MATQLRMNKCERSSGSSGLQANCSPPPQRYWFFLASAVHQWHQASAERRQSGQPSLEPVLQSRLSLRLHSVLDTARHRPTMRSLLLRRAIGRQVPGLAWRRAVSVTVPTAAPTLSHPVVYHEDFTINPIPDGHR